MLTKPSFLRRLVTVSVALGIQLVAIHAGELRAGAVATNTAPLGNLPPADALEACETEPGFAVTLVATGAAGFGDVEIRQLTNRNPSGTFTIRVRKA